jgi:DNA-binding HxlR family transcriptional regulator
MNMRPPVLTTASATCADRLRTRLKAWLSATSLFFELAVSPQSWFNSDMQTSYSQFRPIAKASEVFANRWTPLVLRELMAGCHTFNDIHRGVPLISRAVLVARLRELESEGIIERRARRVGGGHEYWLTPAGNAFRSVISELGHWGLVHARDRLKRNDLGPIEMHSQIGALSFASSSRACRRAGRASVSCGCCSSDLAWMCAPRIQDFPWI